MNNMFFSRKQSGKVNGFTQVELLVSVAVVGLLAMVGISGAAKWSNQGKIARCANNLRQLNMSQLLYAADNLDLLPNTSFTSANWPWDVPVPVTTALLRYGAGTNTMYCPGTSPRFTDEQNFTSPNSLWSYGTPAGFRVIGYATTLGATILLQTNRNITTVPQQLIVAGIVVPPPLPSQRVLTADATVSQDGFNFTSVQGGFMFNGGLYPHISPHLDGAYPAGGNVGMLDGHVEWRVFKDMKARTGSPLFYW